MPELTSIIMCCFNFSRTVAHMAMASIANIRRFTDKEDYELIVIDNEPKWAIRDDYKVLDLEEITHIIHHKDIGYYASYNEGASLAKGKYLCFLQPDVFVHEDWLKAMRFYLEKGLADVVFPDQFPQTREYILDSYDMTMEEGMKYGGRESGCLMITREAFDKTGGWDDRLFNEYGEAAFYSRIGKAGLSWTSTNKSLVTHITAGTRYTMWDEHPEIHNKDMERDGKIWKGIRNEL